MTKNLINISENQSKVITFKRCVSFANTSTVNNTI